MRNYSLLIIDDALFMRRVIRGALEELFAQIEEAANSTEALYQLQCRPFDIITLDLSLDSELPLEGIVLLKQLKKNASKSMVIVISAIDQPRVTNEILAAGASHYIKKPFDDAHLKNIARELMSKTYG